MTQLWAQENTHNNLSICAIEPGETNTRLRKHANPGENIDNLQDPVTVAKSIVKLLGDENVALDFGSYKTAPAGFRIWASGLIEKSDIEALIPWLDWAYNTKIQEIQNA